ncbi:MAG: DUF4199 domain-containing protein [Rikenellaceae bacterium]
MDAIELTKARNREAATGGVVLGVTLYLLVLVDYFSNLSINAGYIVSICNIFIICGLLYRFAVRYRNIRGVEMGMSYGTVYGFILLVMMFAGMIYGVLYFLQTNVIDPTYYTDLQNQIIINNDTLSDEQKDKMLNAVQEAMSNPFIVIVSSVFSTILTGAFFGLIVSAFIKREPKLEEKVEENNLTE